MLKVSEVSYRSTTYSVFIAVLLMCTEIITRQPALIFPTS